MILIIPFFSCFFCSPQMKLNKSKEINVLINNPWRFEKTNEVIYTIENKSNKTYIIDPYGFSGDSYWLFNNERLNPIDRSRGYYSRLTDDDCKNDLIIIHPREKITTYLNLNEREKEIYDLSKEGTYIWNVKSDHTKYNAMSSNCKSYIGRLENKGYVILEDSIVAKILFVR